MGLRWDDIGPASMAILRGVTFPDGNKPDPSIELKNRASRRVLPIPKKLREVLLSTPHIGEYVVPTSTGGVMTSTVYQRLWKNYVASLLDFPLHAHMLRHTYATTLYRAGVDLRTAQQLLGHATIQMAAEIYAHLEAEDSLKAVHSIDEYLKKEPDKSRKNPQQ